MAILTSSLLALTGCVLGKEHPGTQVGVEDQVWCELDSTEVLVDLSLAPDDMDESPRDRIDGLLGVFEGAQLDGEEQSTSLTATLTVSDPGGDVELLRYTAVSDDDEELPDHLCPPRYVFDLDLVLEADGLPTFTETLEVGAHNDGVYGTHQGTTGFDGDLPDPAVLQPEDFDVFEPKLSLSAGWGDWSGELIWYAERDDGLGEDGGPSVDMELVMMTVMSPQ